LHLQGAVGEADGSVEHHVAHRHPGASAQRAEPGIGKFPWRKPVIGVRELQVGLAAILYYDDHFGAAAELLEPIIDASTTLAPDAHARALDWWATALDRQAQAATDRISISLRIGQRMEEELRRDPVSTPANYWLAASARTSGDLDRAMAAVSAAWVRTTLAGDRGEALRTDLDRLVVQAIIPERAARLPARERRQATTTMTADWEAFKKNW